MLLAPRGGKRGLIGQVTGKSRLASIDQKLSLINCAEAHQKWRQINRVAPLANSRKRKTKHWPRRVRTSYGVSLRKPAPPAVVADSRAGNDSDRSGSTRPGIIVAELGTVGAHEHGNGGFL